MTGEVRWPWGGGLGVWVQSGVSWGLLSSAVAGPGPRSSGRLYTQVSTFSNQRTLKLHDKFPWKTSFSPKERTLSEDSRLHFTNPKLITLDAEPCIFTEE